MNAFVVFRESATKGFFEMILNNQFTFMKESLSRDLNYLSLEHTIGFLTIFVDFFNRTAIKFVLLDFSYKNN